MKVSYSEITVKVAVDDTDADAPDIPPVGVAVMVTVVVVVLVVFVVLLPPHAENIPNPAKRTTSSRSSRSRLRFLKPRKQSATARVAGKNGLGL